MALSKSYNKMKILIIGSLPPRIGGATINLELLLKELSKCKSIDFDVVNTSPRLEGPVGAIDRLLRSLWQGLIKMKNVDVVTAHLNKPSIGVPFYL